MGASERWRGGEAALAALVPGSLSACRPAWAQGRPPLRSPTSSRTRASRALAYGTGRRAAVCCTCSFPAAPDSPSRPVWGACGCRGASPLPAEGFPASWEADHLQSGSLARARAPFADSPAHGRRRPAGRRSPATLQRPPAPPEAPRVSRPAGRLPGPPGAAAAPAGPADL